MAGAVMEFLRYLVWGLALFFAIGWTLGLLAEPYGQLKGTVVTIIFWWVEILGVVATDVSAFHLLWLMPLSLILPAVSMLCLLNQVEESNQSGSSEA
jgi:hypothetical protein